MLGYGHGYGIGIGIGNVFLFHRLIGMKRDWTGRATTVDQIRHSGHIRPKISAQSQDECGISVVRPREDFSSRLGDSQELRVPWVPLSTAILYSN